MEIDPRQLVDENTILGTKKNNQAVYIYSQNHNLRQNHNYFWNLLTIRER